MYIQQIIDALKEECERLDRAIAVLEGGSRGPATRRSHFLIGSAHTGRRHMSPEARAKIAAAQRKRWARVKAKQAASAATTGKKK